MSEFDEQDFKNWLAWSVEGNKTAWKVICDQYTDPDKCYRAWSAFKDWVLPIAGRTAVKESP